MNLSQTGISRDSQEAQWLSEDQAVFADLPHNVRLECMALTAEFLLEGVCNPEYQGEFDALALVPFEVTNVSRR